MSTQDAFFTTALRIARDNLGAGIWKVETARLFLKMADKQPNDIRRMLGKRLPSAKTISGDTLG